MVCDTAPCQKDFGTLDSLDLEALRLQRITESQMNVM